MNPPKNPQNNSNLFLQLGLLLTLLIVYLAFNHKTEKQFSALPQPNNIYVEPDVFVMNDFIVEKKKPKPKTIQKQIPKLIDQFKVTKDPEVIETVITDTDPDPIIDPDQIIEVIDDPTENLKPIPYVLVQQAPRFPGCKASTEEEYRICFQEKIQKAIGKSFNTNNIRSSSKGKQKIFVQFLIDKDGEIKEIKAKSSHKSLEKEAIRAVQQLPLMIPAKQQTNHVPVRYTLPIAVYLD